MDHPPLELCPNRVKEGGLTSIPLDLRGLSSGPQRRKLSGESNNDARLPVMRPRAYNPKVAGSNPAPAT